MNLSKKYLSALICVTFAGLFFSIYIGNLLLLILLIVGFFYNHHQYTIQSLKTNHLIWFPIIFFTLHAIGLLYTQNMSNGFFAIEKQIYFLLVPGLLFYPIRNLSNEEYDRLLKNLSLIAFGSSFVVLFIALIKLTILEDPMAFHFEKFSPISYVYYSMYFVCATTSLCVRIVDSTHSLTQKIFYASVLVIYSIGFLVLVSCKMAIIAFVLCLFYLFYKKLQNKKMLITAIVITITSLALFISLSKTTQDRFLVLTKNFEILDKDHLSGGDEEFNGLNLRLLFWKYTLQEVATNNLQLIGAGTGDAQDLVNGSYVRHHLDEYGYVGFDPHNQWIFTYAQLGLIGIVALIVMYWFSFRSAIRSENLPFFFFLLTTLLFSVTESILESNKGIVFFSLVFTLFASGNGKVRENSF
jgi:O-antigen ligase